MMTIQPASLNRHQLMTRHSFNVTIIPIAPSWFWARSHESLCTFRPLKLTRLFLLGHMTTDGTSFSPVQQESGLQRLMLTSS